MRSFIRALLLMGVALPAQADTAMVVGSVDMDATTSYGAPRYIGTALTPLDQAGFSVFSSIDASGERLRDLVGAVATQGEEDRLVIALAGRFVTYGGLTWFLGADAGEVTLGSVSGAGIPVQLLLDMAAEVDDAIVLLGPEDQGVPLGTGLANGLGELAVPNGVTLATGHPAAVAQFAAQNLLEPGRPLRDVFAAAPGLTVVALDQPFRPFIPSPIVTPTINPDDQSYWDAMSTLDNIFAYRAYLNRYPNGYYAAEARARIALLEPPVPQLTPEEVEDALSLNRNQRRDIQRDLAVLGYYNSGIDGLFGQGSRRGIRDWQQNAGLQVTGYLDADQIALLHDQADTRRAQIRAADRAYWQETGRGTDEPGLRAYLDRYPNGEFSDLARTRLQEIEEERERQADRDYWNQTGRGQTEQGLRAYLDRYPQGEFSQLARQRLNSILAQREADFWNQVRAADSIQAYRAYLQDYPNGPHAQEARQRLRQLQQVHAEPAAWQEARDTDSVQAYRDYLNEYPNGPHAAEARQRINAIRDDDQAWQAADDTGTGPAYRQYLDAYPNGRHTQEAQQRLQGIQAENRAWRAATDANTADSYRAYLQAYPNGRFVDEARDRLEALNPGPDPAIGQMGRTQLRLAYAALSQSGVIPRNADDEESIVAGLRRYQQANGLPNTGILDNATMAHMVLNGLVRQ